MGLNYNTADGRYLVADQGDGNLVVYDQRPNQPMRAVWDRWSYEAATGSRNDLPAPVDRPAPLPIQDGATPNPVAAAVQHVQVTQPEDGPFVNRGYSYWAAAYRAAEYIYCFAGHADGHPRFYQVDGSLNVLPLGPLLNQFNYLGTGENLYWDKQGNLYFLRGAALHRVNIWTGADEVVMDAAQGYPGCDLWQPHSSDDGRVHSATLRQVVQEGAYPLMGTLLQNGRSTQYYPANTYALDESQVTPDGGFLLIKSSPYDDNLVIDVETGTQRWLDMREGAFGHSDCGYGCAVGADRINGGIALMDYYQPLAAGKMLYEPDWSVGHIALRGRICIVTDAEAVYQLRMDGSGLNRLWNHEQQGDPSNYDNQVKANLSPDSSVACYLANNQLHLLILR